MMFTFSKKVIPENDTDSSQSNLINRLSSKVKNVLTSKYAAINFDGPTIEEEIYEEIIQQLPPISIEELENTRLLFDYLSINGTLISSDRDKLQVFGKLVMKCIEELPADSQLTEMLQLYGWSGMSFLHILDIDFSSLHKALGTLYMNGKQQLAKYEKAFNTSSSKFTSNNVSEKRFDGSPNKVMSFSNSSYQSLTDSPMGSPMKQTRGLLYNADDTTEELYTPMHAIASFTPDSLIYALLNTTMLAMIPNTVQIPNSSKFKTFYGVSLLADISGFTKLSSNFCLRGSSGLDDLHNVTSGFLGRLVKIIYWFNGDGTLVMLYINYCINSYIKYIV